MGDVMPHHVLDGGPPDLARRIDRLDGYEWPAANLRLNAMLLQWVTANP